MTNLTNTRWRFRTPVDFSMLSIPTGGFTIKWNINFVNAIGQSKTYLSVYRSSWSSATSVPEITESGSTVYRVRNGVPKWTKWADEIYITGGADVANADLIAFLDGNADPYYFYRAEKHDLIAVADAIRAKGGTSEPLEFPSGFVTAINDITTPIPSNYGLITYNGSIITVS